MLDKWVIKLQNNKTKKLITHHAEDEVNKMNPLNRNIHAETHLLKIRKTTTLSVKPILIISATCSFR